MSPTNEEFLAELRRLGVPEVKNRIATNVYLGGLRSIAQGWVDQEEATSNVEQLSLARQAHKLAQKSNWIAIVAVGIALISLIIAQFKH